MEFRSRPSRRRQWRARSQRPNVSAAQRAGRGREHLSRCARHRAGQPRRAGEPAAGADGTVRRRPPRRGNRGLPRGRSAERPVQTRLLLGDCVGAASQGAAARGGVGLGPQVYGSLREAMIWYERAEAIRPAGKRRPAPSVDHLRGGWYTRSPAGAGDRGAGGTFVSRIGIKNLGLGIGDRGLGIRMAGPAAAP